MSGIQPPTRRLVAGSLIALGGTGGALAADRLDRFRTGRSGGGQTDHGAFDDLLGRHVRASADGVNRVDYAGWKASPANHARLSGYIAALERVDPAVLTRPEQFAFWVNLYNASTLKVVLDRYPVRSIRQIKPNPIAFGPWKQPVATVGGTVLSLDEMEHGILRKAWRDPRVHYTVNCAAIGCPNLRRRAFRGATLEADLREAASDYVNHPRGARFEGRRLEDRRLVASSIYDWYRGDFGGSDSGVIAHLSAHAAPDLKARLAGVTDVARHGYDWTLNDAGPR